MYNLIIKIIIMWLVLLLEQVVGLPILFLGLFLMWGVSFEKKWWCGWVVGWGIILASVWGWSWSWGVVALALLWGVWQKWGDKRWMVVMGLAMMGGLGILMKEHLDWSWRVTVYTFLSLVLLWGAWQITLKQWLKTSFWS